MQWAQTQAGPIGVFDSGVGGLTVVREICNALPGEDVIYLGDTARVPYGSKSPGTVRKYALNTARFLVERGAKMLVIACNTASAVAVDDLRRTFSVPVLEVIEPGALEALRVSKTAKIGVLGTQATVSSGAYTAAITKANPSARVVAVSCPLLVPLAEEGWTEGLVTHEVIRHYLRPLADCGVDALVLGCTHYPILKRAIGQVLAEVVGEDVVLVDSARAVAQRVAEELVRARMAKPGPNGQGRRQFFFTDCPDPLHLVGKRFFGDGFLGVQQVDL